MFPLAGFTRSASLLSAATPNRETLSERLDGGKLEGARALVGAETPQEPRGVSFVVSNAGFWPTCFLDRHPWRYRHLSRAAG